MDAVGTAKNTEKKRRTYLRRTPAKRKLKREPSNFGRYCVDSTSFPGLFTFLRSETAKKYILKEKVMHFSCFHVPGVIATINTTEI